MTTKQFDQTSSYYLLKKEFKIIKKLNLSQLFENTPARSKDLSIKTKYIYFDYSKQLLTKRTIGLLIKLAKETNLKEKIDAMFKGKKINKTENRSVLHIALRNSSGIPIITYGKDIMPDIKEVLNKIKKFSNGVLSGKKRGITGRKFKNIVSIGIGGSYLGPEYLAVALKPYAKKNMNLIFIANVDGSDFHEKTMGLDASETLFVVVSKTFTTAETMKNAETAKNWLLKKTDDNPEAVKKHFIAVSTAKDKVESFGIDCENMFEFWDFVGGRFSATSAVGAVPLSLYLGFDNFNRILEGAYWMDCHFNTAPFDENIPILCALIDIWNINFLGYKTRALLPYSQGLSKLPAHTQQVEMESNGKSVDIYGTQITFDTGEIVFGEPGTNGQHSFYQLLHQGTQIIPCDFIGFIKPQYETGKYSNKEVTHHEELMTNFLAQPDALAFGKTDKYPPKNFTGNRPSSSFLLYELTPFTAGILLALTEHRAAVKGFIWDINSFDQFGVELGKTLGVDQRNRILEFHKTGKINKKGINQSTAKILEALLTKELPS